MQSFENLIKNLKNSNISFQDETVIITGGAGFLGSCLS